MELTRLSDYICTIAKNGQRLYFYRGRRISKRDIPEDFLDQIECLTLEDRRKRPLTPKKSIRLNREKDIEREEEREEESKELIPIQRVDIAPSGFSSQRELQLSGAPIQPNLLSDVPRDVLITYTNQLSDRDLYSLCQTDRRLRDLCRDERFWKQRYRTFIDPNVDVVPEWYDNWREAYRKEKKIREIKNKKFLFREEKIKQVIKYDLRRYIDELLEHDAYISHFIVEAIRNKNLTLFEYLLLKGKEYNKNIDVYEWREIIQHLPQLGDLQLLKEFIDQHRNINLDNNYMLEHAAIGGDRKVIDFIIKRGVTDFYRGLQGAVKNGKCSLIRYFLDLNRAFDSRYISDQMGHLLLMAVQSGKSKTLYCLLDEFTKRDLIFKTKDAMVEAARNNRRDMIDLMIEYGSTAILSAYNSAYDEELKKYLRSKLKKDPTEKRSTIRTKSRSGRGSRRKR